MKLSKEKLRKIILSEIITPEEMETELSPEHSEFLHDLIDGMEKLYYAIENVKNIVEQSDIEPDDMDVDIDRELLLLRRAAKKFTKVMNREYNLELEDSGIDYYSDVR